MSLLSPIISSSPAQTCSPVDLNASFNVGDISFDTPDDMDEESVIQDNLENATLPTDEGGVTFTVVEEGSKRCKPKLVDNLGYVYTVKQIKTNVTYWACSSRPPGNRCPATVVQKDSAFERSNNRHIHAPKVDALVNTQIHAAVRSKAKEDIFTSGSRVVNDILLNKVEGNQPLDSLPTVNTLVRIANRCRQKMRPADPVDLDFELHTEHLPENFLKADIKNGSRRHLIFAIDEQLALLAKARRWYIDGTFFVVKPPFYQLVTFHAFIKDGDKTKQVPLVYILMSGKRKIDYTEVLEVVIQRLPHPPQVRGVMLDFEAAIWKAVGRVLPDVEVKGCVFHFTQAVYRKIQELGLQTAYTDKSDAHKFMRKLLALPFLPHEHITATFDQLVDGVTETKLVALIQYIRTTWINSTVWPPSSWSCFNRSVRTNNDVEGWHRALNIKAGRPLQFFVLIPLLRKEASIVNLQVRLVGEHKLQRYQRRAYSTMQGQLFKLWDKYDKRELSTTQLLRSCAHMYAPNPDHKY